MKVSGSRHVCFLLPTQKGALTHYNCALETQKSQPWPLGPPTVKMSTFSPSARMGSSRSCSSRALPLASAAPSWPRAKVAGWLQICFSPVSSLKMSLRRLRPAGPGGAQRHFIPCLTKGGLALGHVGGSVQLSADWTLPKGV